MLPVLHMPECPTTTNSYERFTVDLLASLKVIKATLNAPRVPGWQSVCCRQLDCAHLVAVGPRAGIGPLCWCLWLQ